MWGTHCELRFSRPIFQHNYLEHNFLWVQKAVHIHDRFVDCSFTSDVVLAEQQLGKATQPLVI
jgi:hypothetical protein